MSRLLLHVEGQTEETFVNDVLAPHLRDRGYDSVRARLVGNARRRDRRGGIRDWNAVRRDIANHLKEDTGSFATTMVDYYGLPGVGRERGPDELARRRSRSPRRRTPWRRRSRRTSVVRWAAVSIRIDSCRTS